MIKRFVLYAAIICLAPLAKAQEMNDATSPIIDLDDSTKIDTPISQDTVLIQMYAKRYNPSKASMYAAVLPGLGQIYNKKYWKLPLVYGGIGSMAYFLTRYQDLYKQYKGELYYILETGAAESLEKHSEAQLRPQIDNVRRQRDFMIILLAGMYVLQIVDAHVDAHLKEFDVNPNLQVRLRPSMQNDVMTGRQTGLTLTLTF